MKRGLGAAVFIAAFAALLAPGSASAVGTLDQQQTVVESEYPIVGALQPSAVGVNSLAATFTAGATGALVRVDLFLSKQEPSLPLSVEITAVNSGEEPESANVLAATTVPATEVHESVAGGSFVPITFAPAAAVTAGTKYAIVAYTLGSGFYYWGGSRTDVYAGGSSWLSKTSPPSTWQPFPGFPPGLDFAFKTYVAPPPKPTALTTKLSGEGKEGETITVNQSEPVEDHATLSGENAAKASGTITYKAYSNNTCTGSAEQTDTKTFSGGSVPASDPITLAPGTYHWQAEYSGDENNEKSTSLCTEVETVTAKPATCGKTTVGKSSDQLVANEKRVNRCVVPYNALVNEISVYLAPTSHFGSQLVKGIFYADNKGKPGALVGTTGKLTFTSKSPAGWYHLVFTTPLKVAAGNYWIGIITGSTSLVGGERYDSVSGAEDYNYNTYTSGPSNPFGSFTTTNEQMSLYATFEREVCGVNVQCR